ncbi:olfactory receptor 2AE1-like [Ictidomys tridecemlineatus]
MWLRNQRSLADFILERLFEDSFTHLFLFCLTMVVYHVALSGNTLTIHLICVDRGLHTPMYFLLSQLSLMDKMHVCTIIPKIATNYLSSRKSISFMGCATQHFLYLSLGGAECLLLALTSYDRYVAIYHPLHYNVLMSRKVALLMALTSWLGASLNFLIHTFILMYLPFCEIRKIHHLYCEYQAVMKLVCVDVTVYESTVYISTIMLLLLPIILVSTSYGFILHSVIEMRSAGTGISIKRGHCTAGGSPPESVSLHLCYRTSPLPRRRHRLQPQGDRRSGYATHPPCGEIELPQPNLARWKFVY